MGNESAGRKGRSRHAVSPELIEAIRLECGLQCDQEQNKLPAEIWGYGKGIVIKSMILVILENSLQRPGQSLYYLIFISNSSNLLFVSKSLWQLYAVDNIQPRGWFTCTTGYRFCQCIVMLWMSHSSVRRCIVSDHGSQHKILHGLKEVGKFDFALLLPCHSKNHLSMEK